MLKGIGNFPVREATPARQRGKTRSRLFYMGNTLDESIPTCIVPAEKSRTVCFAFAFAVVPPPPPRPGQIRIGKDAEPDAVWSLYACQVKIRTVTWWYQWRKRSGRLRSTMNAVSSNSATLTYTGEGRRPLLNNITTHFTHGELLGPKTGDALSIRCSAHGVNKRIAESTV